MHPIARKYVSWLMYPSFCCRVLAVANSKVCHLFEETSMCVGKWKDVHMLPPIQEFRKAYTHLRKGKSVEEPVGDDNDPNTHSISTVITLTTNFITITILFWQMSLAWKKSIVCDEELCRRRPSMDDPGDPGDYLDPEEWQPKSFCHLHARGGFGFVAFVIPCWSGSSFESSCQCRVNAPKLSFRGLPLWRVASKNLHFFLFGLHVAWLCSGWKWSWHLTFRFGLKKGNELPFVHLASRIPDCLM